MKTTRTFWRRCFWGVFILMLLITLRLIFAQALPWQFSNQEFNREFQYYMTLSIPPVVWLVMATIDYTRKSGWR